MHVCWHLLVDVKELVKNQLLFIQVSELKEQY